MISLTVNQDTLMYALAQDGLIYVQAAPLGTFACEKHITYPMAIYVHWLYACQCEQQEDCMCVVWCLASENRMNNLYFYLILVLFPFTGQK